MQLTHHHQAPTHHAACEGRTARRRTRHARASSSAIGTARDVQRVCTSVAPSSELQFVDSVPANGAVPPPRQQRSRGPAEEESRQQHYREQGISEHKWPWRWGSKIRYLKAGTQGPALLLVHGFGVAAWHFERNLPGLAKHYQVYAIDLLGQGCSWPDMSRVSVMASMDAADALEGEGAVEQAAASQQQQRQQGAGQATGEVVCGDGPLEFCTDTWTEELADFVEQVIGQPAYVAGNSLGGYLAVSLAASHPHLVKGLVLLNATPFWSFRPPKGQPQGIWSFLPPPAVPVSPGLKRTVETVWWDRLRSRETVNSMLGMVYVHKPVVTHDTSVAERIICATEHPAALDAFVSIVSAHKPTDEFEHMLVSARCPVCLVYGRQDPWVVPVWGQRAKHVLTKAGRPPPMYLELDGAGHCPHHEAPRATNLAITSCLSHMEQLAATSSHPSSASSSSSSSSSSGVAASSQQQAPVGGMLVGRDDLAPVADGGWEQAAVAPPFAVGERFEVLEEEEEEEEDGGLEEVHQGSNGASSSRAAGAESNGGAGGEAAQGEGAAAGQAASGAARQGGKGGRRTVVLEHVDGRPRILPERISHWLWGYLERGSGSSGAATSGTAGRS